MPVQKLVLQLTVMCDTDTLEEAVVAYSSMTLEQIQHSTAFGEDIGSGVSIVASETIDGREIIVAEIQETGDDGYRQSGVYGRSVVVRLHSGRRCIVK